VAVASAGHMQVCTSLQTDNHASTSPLSFLQARCPSCRPTNSIKALKAVPEKNIRSHTANLCGYYAISLIISTSDSPLQLPCIAVNSDSLSYNITQTFKANMWLISKENTTVHCILQQI